MNPQTTTLTPPESALQPAGAAPPGSRPASPGTVPGSWARRLWRGNAEDPRWVRPALIGLLIATGALYLWGLGASGWANSFYSAAAQAGSESWKALFFGSSDAASSITVDKTPLSLWAMALSVRVFGLSSWSILVPQALMGVASVGLLFGTVRRASRSAAAGLLAGVVLSLTPVAVLMFRFNNPDALLVLLLIGSLGATMRALDATNALASGRAAHPMRWLALGGALVGLAFLTKMMQAFLVLPALALVYVLAANTPLGKRFLHLLVAFGSMVVAGGWWVLVVELWPAASRPYIGGSQNNSVLELTLGYNGLGRLTGDEAGSVGGAGAGGGWGDPGILRMLNSEIGAQVAWLLPAALILLTAGLWFTRRAPRTDPTRAGLVVWGGWLAVTSLTFSFMAGIFHAYYTVALAPAIAALVGIGGITVWRHRHSYAAALVMSTATAFTAAFDFFLLDRTPDYLPWLKWVVVLLGLSSALVIVAVGHLPRAVALTVAGTALASVLVAPAAYSLSTAATPHAGSIPSAGPSSSGQPGGGPGGARLGATIAGGPAGTAGGGPAGTTGTTGSLLNGSESTDAITALLQADTGADTGTYTWAAAAIGANTAAGYQLASAEPVMAIGGFNGTDPSPTLAQFENYVANGEIHYFIAGGAGGGGAGGAGGFGGGGGPGGGMSASGSSSSSISEWVAENFTALTVDGVTIYDLSTGVR